MLAGVVGGTAVAISAMGFVSRILSQRRMARIELSSDEIAQRLERLEQGMEAIATQVERLGETNRYVAKLLAERAESPRISSGNPPNVP
jgi:hypothetical protein